MESIVKKNASFIGKDCFAIYKRDIIKIHVLYLSEKQFISRIVWPSNVDDVGEPVISDENEEFYSTFEDARVALWKISMNRINEMAEKYKEDIITLKDLFCFPLIYDIKHNKVARAAYCDKVNELYMSKR